MWSRRYNEGARFIDVYAHLIDSGLPLKDQRQDIETQMLDELRHREKLLLAVWATWYDDTFAAGLQGFSYIEEAIEVVLPEFRLHDRK
jgi:hypothetical protein